MTKPEITQKCDEIRAALKVAMFEIELPELIHRELERDIDTWNLEGKFSDTMEESG